MKITLILLFLLSSIVSFAQQTGTITDARDGKTYKTVVIGTQTWMAENLNVSTFRNGDTIPEVKSNEEWIKAAKNKQPAWCYYDNYKDYGRIYGKLYNWFAVNDARGLAPIGYHIPSQEELELFYDYLGNDSGKKMKSTPIYKTEITYVDQGGYNETKWVPCNNCSYWTEKQKANNPCSACRNQRGKNINTGKYIPKTKKKVEDKILVGGWNGTNESGFTGLPGGYRYLFGNFSEIGSHGYWWSSTANSESSAFYRYLSYGDLAGHVLFMEGGLSVRCLKNSIGEGENPFGDRGLGEKSMQGFGSVSNDNDQGDGTICSCSPTNLNTIINLLKNNVIVTRPTSATVTIQIKADGSISSIYISGLGGSDISVEKKIKEIISRTTFTPCNGKNRNSRCFTFPKIVLRQN